MPATTRRAAKAAASSSVTEPLSGNDDKSQTPIAARLDAEMPIMEEPATDDIHIAILAMVKAVCETTALNEALITDIDFEAENDLPIAENTRSTSSDLERQMTCTFATVPAYPSEIKELASSVIDQSASPVINDPQPMIIDKSTLPVVEEPEQMTVDKSNLSIIDEPALPTVTLPMVDEPSPPTMTSPRVDKPAPSVVDKSSGTWSFNGYPIILDEDDSLFITKASTAEGNSHNDHHPSILFNADAEATRAQRNPEGWVDIPGLQRCHQQQMAQKRKHKTFIANIMPDKNRTLKELKADLKGLQKEHHKHVTVYEEMLQRLIGRISELEDLQQSKLDMPFGQGHLHEAMTNEPKDLRKRKALTDELDGYKIRIGTDVYSRASVYASLSSSGVRFGRKSHGKKRQKIDVDFGDVDLQDSLKGLGESDIKAILEAQKDLEDGGE